MNTHASMVKDLSAGALSAAVEQLRSACKGAVITAADDGYNAARAVWNAMIDRRPAVIVRPRDAADVSAAVTIAHANGMPISIKGGGHNVAGHAVGAESLMVDLSLMRAVSVDAERRIASVEGGAIWRDVDAATQRHCLATPGGLISETGVAGLTLSGGIGWLRSRCGLTIDNLVAADVVVADGRLLRASSTENSDLLWALKGGGGNFGVVTRFEFALHRFGPQAMFCAPIYPIDRAAEAVRIWRDFLRDKNDRVGSLAEFSTIPESPDFPTESWGQRVVTLAAVYPGDAAEGAALLQPLRDIGGAIADFSGEMDYCDIQKLFDTLMPTGAFRCYWKSHFLGGLSDDVIDAIVEGNRQPPSANTLSSIWNFGGATAAVAPDATAFGDRTMAYMFSIDSAWRDPADDDRNIAWTRAFWQRMRPHAHRNRMYLNFPGLGEEGEDLVRNTFGDNYERLIAIKRKYDPTNLFRFNPNIRP